MTAYVPNTADHGDKESDSTGHHQHRNLGGERHRDRSAADRNRDSSPSRATDIDPDRHAIIDAHSVHADEHAGSANFDIRSDSVTDTDASTPDGDGDRGATADLHRYAGCDHHFGAERHAAADRQFHPPAAYGDTDPGSGQTNHSADKGPDAGADNGRHRASDVNAESGDAGRWLTICGISSPLG